MSNLINHKTEDNFSRIWFKLLVPLTNVALRPASSRVEEQQSGELTSFFVSLLEVFYQTKWEKLDM